MALIRVESETSLRQAHPNTCHCDKGEVLDYLNALPTIVDIVMAFRIIHLKVHHTYWLDAQVMQSDEKQSDQTCMNCQ